MNTSEVDLKLRKFDSKGFGYSHDRSEAIGFVFRCDMMTAQKIVNRIGNKMGIGTDPIVVLKTADASVIAQCALEELEFAWSHQTDS